MEALERVAAMVVTVAALTIARNATEMIGRGILDERTNVTRALMGAWRG